MEAFLLMTDLYDRWIIRGEEPPSVDRPASRERAEREGRSFIFSKRQEKLLDLLLLAGFDGLTWKEAGEALGMHHGQISGALSTLHARGNVFAMKKQRGKCHIYLHQAFREHYREEDVFDSPAKTKARRDREIAEAAEALMVILDRSTPMLTSEQFDALERLRKVIEENER